MSLSSIILEVLGGLALFLYGLSVLSNGFKKIFSSKLKQILTTLTKNPIRGVGLGAFVTSIIQSSSITVVTLIGLLNAGLLNLRQAVGVMLGAEIGTTVTAQIVAFKIGIYYSPILFIGFILWFFSRSKKLQYIGQVILGFGLLFLGMHLMSSGLKPLREIPFFINLLIRFGQIPILGVLAGALFTAVIQSSSATIGLVIAMGMEGIINLPSAIALALGANIGTCVTGALASIKSSLSARRLAISQLLVNIFGVLLFVFLLSPFSRVVALTSSNLSRQIANAHTFFNVIVTLTAIPLVGWLVKLTTKIVPGREIEIEKGTKFLDEKILNVPSVAILQAHKEILRMAAITQTMLQEAKEAFFTQNKSLARSIKEREVGVDELHHIIDNYLTKISSLDLSEDESQILTFLIHSVTDIERVADHADNLAEILEFKIKQGLSFSSKAQEELKLMFEESIQSFSTAISAFKNYNKEKAQKVLEIEEEINQLEKTLRESHYQRLREGVCKQEAGPIYLEVLSNLERISDHAENIATGIILDINL